MPIMADWLLWRRRYQSNADRINIKDTFMTSLYGGKRIFWNV